ncbi:MAG: cytochrome c3 family protein [Candidatus Acidiferrum sp.]
MKCRWLSLGLAVGACYAIAQAQTPPPAHADSLGMHNLSVASGSQVTTPGSLGCTFCHAPHSGVGGNTPLWNQTLSGQTYTPYTSSTYQQQGNTQPTLGKSSSLCLSCHDGTVAVGQTVAYGKISVSGSMNNMDVLGTNLSGSHPFSLVLPMKDAPDLAASLVAQQVTADPTGKVKLVQGNVECTSCHNPHSQSIDPIAQNFLVKDGSNGQMCLACHDPNRVINGKVNLLSGWAGSIHATAPNQVASSAHVGSYSTVALNACTSCHMQHNAGGPVRLLRPATPAAPGMDPTTQDCITCHNGGTNISPVAPNVYAEFSKIGHPLPAGANAHDTAEPTVLNNNRHATCADCHSPHAANTMSVFGLPPAIRPPQAGVTGVSGVDGVTVLTPAVNQYENCLRCHGTSAGKQVLIKYGYLPTRLVFSGDPLNLVPQFSLNATSSHPVVHDRMSALPQPSLRVNMLNENGTASSRLVTTRIFCTDCHDSDDNREFGGTGPNGPHGSSYPHILERNYQFSQGTTPGGTVTNTYPTPDLSPQGPYALCAKCHDLTNILSNASWTQHNRHISQDGFSCSVCHTAHGMGAVVASVSGERLVNFDINVVAQNQAAPISYNRATNTCTLQCHNAAHNPNGTVSVNGTALPNSLPGRKH